MILNVF